MIKKEAAPLPKNWPAVFTAKLDAMKEDEVIEILMNRGETTGGAQSAWRRMAKLKGYTSHIHMIKHQLGTTLYLSFNKNGRR